MSFLENIAAWNDALRTRSPRDIVTWALAQAGGRAIVSTNFRPYEAAILHLVTQAQPSIPVLWVDHGFNRSATYQHAEALRARLRLDLRAYLPSLSRAHYEAVYGPPPSPDDEPGLRRFSALMKLEPFQRGMRELAPTVWFTALRRVQNPHRAALDVVGYDEQFGTLKISPFLEATDADLDAYLSAHDLPNEWDYHDPAKADEKRECGLHAAWGRRSSAA